MIGLLFPSDSKIFGAGTWRVNYVFVSWAASPETRFFFFLLLAPSLSSAPSLLTPLKATQEVVQAELLCGSVAFYCPVGLILFLRKSRVARASDENGFLEHQLVFSRFAYASGNHRIEGSFCFYFPFGSPVSAIVYWTITSWFLGRMRQG